MREIEIKPLPDLLKGQFSDQMVNKVMEIEKLRMQRTRAANKGVWKIAVEYYNKSHKDSELKITDYGIIQVVKI